jgi:putative transposase
MYIPGLPYHLVQRGNNRSRCFAEAEDHQYYLYLLAREVQLYGVQLHAYVLMSNHVHLLMTPEETDSISSLTRVLGSRFATYMNKKYQRTGTLWEGRHKSSPVDSERYLLTCYRYIELNPVRAGMCKRPEDYPWSSYRMNALLADSDIVEPHEAYLALGKSPGERANYYRQLFQQHIQPEELDQIRGSLHFCQPLGDGEFRNRIETTLGRPIGHMRTGRPRTRDLLDR